MAPDIRTKFSYTEKGLKKQGEFTDLAYENFWEYCRFLGAEVIRPKTPEDITKIAKELGF